MFSAQEARQQSETSWKRNVQERLYEFEQLIKQAAQCGKRQVITEDILCHTQAEYVLIKRVEQELVRNGYEVGLAREVTSSCNVVYLVISW